MDHLFDRATCENMELFSVLADALRGCSDLLFGHAEHNDLFDVTKL